MNIEKFDFSTNLGQVILWQYEQSTNLDQIIQDKQNWIDLNQQQFWENWLESVFTLANSNPEIINSSEFEFGLGVWSIILMAPLFSSVAVPDYTDIWGFNSNGVLPDYVNFTRGPFYYARLISLTQPQQEFLLLLKYFDCVTRGALTDFSTINFPIDQGQHWADSAPNQYFNNYPIGINYFFVYLLTDLFGGLNLGPLIGYTGTIYCLDNLDMSITYQFSTNFPLNLFNAITDLDLWPRPAGVSISYETL